MFCFLINYYGGGLWDSKLLEKTLPCTANVQAITMLISQNENKTKQNKKKDVSKFRLLLRNFFLNVFNVIVEFWE